MGLACMRNDKQYQHEEKVLLTKILLENNCTKDYILRIVPLISMTCLPTGEQMQKLISLAKDSYAYNNDYIDDKALYLGEHEEMRVAYGQVYFIDTTGLKNYIYEHGEIPTLLEEIGCWNVQKHNGYFSCGNHDGDNPSAIVVKDNPYIGVINYTREKEFNKQADIITLVQYNLGYGFNEAKQYLENFLDINGDNSAKQILNNTIKQSRNIPAPKNCDELKVLYEINLEKYEPLLHIDWVRQGITERTRKKFDIRYSYEGKQIIIPIRHHQTGQLLAISARTTQEHYEEFNISKYKVSDGYQKNKNIFGLYENKDYIKQAGICIVFEAEKSVFKRDSLLDSTALALQGHSLSDAQADILASLDVDIIISMDNDVAIEEIKSICNKLSKRTSRNIYYTIDNHGYLGKKDSVADMSRHIYDTILSEKVLYKPAESKC